MKTFVSTLAMLFGLSTVAVAGVSTVEYASFAHMFGAEAIQPVCENVTEEQNIARPECLQETGDSDVDDNAGADEGTE